MMSDEAPLTIIHKMPSKDRRTVPKWNKDNPDKQFLVELFEKGEIKKDTTPGQVRKAHDRFEIYPYDNFNSNLNFLKKKFFKDKAERGKLSR
jgi:hypothetical protein